MFLEMLIVLFGMCLVFFPALCYVIYLLSSVTKKKKFDYHIEKVKDKHGQTGVIIAYIDKILLGLWIICLGIYLSSYFINDVAFDIFLVTFIVYIIVRFIDNKNEN